MIKDVFCLVARVGDKVAYAPGGAGAQEFRTGSISKIAGKTVIIVDHGEVDCMNYTKTIRRGSGCFVIDIDSRKEETEREVNSLSSSGLTEQERKSLIELLNSRRQPGDKLRALMTKKVKYEVVSDD